MSLFYELSYLLLPKTVQGKYYPIPILRMRRQRQKLSTLLEIPSESVAKSLFEHKHLDPTFWSLQPFSVLISHSDLNPPAFFSSSMQWGDLCL